MRIWCRNKNMHYKLSDGRAVSTKCYYIQRCSIYESRAQHVIEVQGESKRMGPYGKKIFKIDVDMIFEKLVSGI